MKWLSIIFLFGFIRGLYYIFKEAKDENIVLRIGCFLLNLINLFAFLYLANILNYQQYIEKRYIYIYILSSSVLLLYGVYLKPSLKNNETKEEYIKNSIKILLAILLYIILRYLL